MAGAAEGSGVAGVGRLGACLASRRNRSTGDSFMDLRTAVLALERSNAQP